MKDHERKEVLQQCKFNTVYKIREESPMYVATGGWLWVATKRRRKVTRTSGSKSGSLGTMTLIDKDIG